MKLMLAVALMGTLFGVAALGVFGMHTGTPNHEAGCPVSMTQGIDCPLRMNPLGYASFHLNAFKEFSLADFSKNSLGLLLAALVIILALSMRSYVVLLPRLSLRPEYPRGLLSSFSSPSHEPIIHWLAFHTHSPSFR